MAERIDFDRLMTAFNITIGKNSNDESIFVPCTVKDLSDKEALELVNCATVALFLDHRSPRIVTDTVSDLIAS